MVVDIDTRDGFRPSQPRVLFDSPDGPTVPLRSSDVGPDGRFIMTRPAGDPEPPFTQLEVVFNWTEELRRRH